MTVRGVGGACLSPPRSARVMHGVGQSLGGIAGGLLICLAQTRSCGANRSFRCGGIPGNRKGLRLKVAWGFVRWGGLAQTSPEKQEGRVPCAIF